MTEILIGSFIIVTLVMLLAAGLLTARRLLVPQGALTVTVNESRRIEAARGDRLLAVLHGAGVAIPAGCGGVGTCGLCRVTAEGEGAGDVQPTERGILSGAERRAHMRLACQVSLRGPVAVTVPSEILAAEGFACRVLSNRMLAPLIRELIVDLPKDRHFAFRAGGFAQLTAPAYSLDFARIDVPEPFAATWQTAGWRGLRIASDRPVTRAYSIASRPDDKNRIVFNIRLAVPPAGREAEVPPGIVSSYLFSLKPGDSLDVSGPFGAFHAQLTTREMVFIGGGVGMAPLRALIHEQIGQQSGRKMTYFYGARSAADLFYVEEFEQIAAANERFDWVPALSDPAPGDRWTGATGFVHETVRAHLSRHPAPEECEYYLCGPPMMIAAVFSTLKRLGVERKSIFNDDFGV